MTEKQTSLIVAPAEPAGPSITERMFQGIMDAVQNPDVDPAKMRALLEVQTDLIDRQARSDFTRAKMAAIAEMPSIDKRGAIKNKAGQVQSRYSRYEDIDRIVKPICARHGLVYSFNVGENSRGLLTVECQLSHTGGHVENCGQMPIPQDGSGSKNATQGQGSALSYGKRYTLCAALNIICDDEDDDGAAASGRRQIEAEQYPWADELVEQARSAAAGGSGAYAEFFGGLSPIRKGWLVESGEHSKLKEAAAEHD